MSSNYDEKGDLRAKIVAAAELRIRRKQEIDPYDYIGSMFRSREEVYDMIERVKPYVEHSIFVGLCGGRARWQTTVKPPLGLVHYLDRHHNKTVSQSEAERILSRLPDFDPTKFAEDPVNLTDYGLPYIIPYGALIHDIDVLVVTQSLEVRNPFIQQQGSRSGTEIDLFFVSPAVISGAVKGRTTMSMFEESIGLAI